MIVQPTEGDALILGAFRPRFGSGTESAYSELCKLLDSITLPFSLRDQMSKMEFLPTQGWENGLPPAYYYFVQDTGWGSEREFPADPLNDDFVYSSDGFGLNLGCPLRLYFAIRRLKRLSDQGDITERLSKSKSHLAAIEELLWADVWEESVSVRRAIPPKSGSWFDWQCEREGTTLNIECKFRPSDWARLVDGEAFQPKSLLAKASLQLPLEKQGSLNIAAITGIAHVDNPLLALMEEDLKAHPHIDAIAYAPLTGEISVHSLKNGICDRIVPFFVNRRADHFQPFYPNIHNLAQKEARVKARQEIVTPKVPVSLESKAIPTLRAQRIVREGKGAQPYRVNISSRNPLTNEPKMHVVPSHYWGRSDP